jgi:hypothetical protein
MVERVIARRQVRRDGGKQRGKQSGSCKAAGGGWEYLVKWLGLDYTECTWESEQALKDDQVG